MGGRSLTDLPLMVLESVEEAGIIGRAWDALRLWFR
jgi:D-alanyl-D-alanine carboxypeptidase (penicillin-binding protein 5/6)